MLFAEGWEENKRSDMPINGINPNRSHFRNSFLMHPSNLFKSGLAIALLSLLSGCGGLPQEAVDRNHKNSRGETINLALNRYANDATLSLLPDMPSIHSLTLDYAQTTDAGMPHIAKLTNLRMLALNGTGITDEASVYLEKLTNLDQLELANTRITDQSVASFKKLPKLRVLNLEGTGITDRGLKEMPSYQLQGLVLNGTGITDEVAHLAKLENLDSLRLNDTNITDAAIESTRKS